MDGSSFSPSIEDGSYFVELLAREIAQHKWLCHAYCLLEDHYHLVIETPEANLGRGMGPPEHGLFSVVWPRT